MVHKVQMPIGYKKSFLRDPLRKSDLNEDAYKIRELIRRYANAIRKAKTIKTRTLHELKFNVFSKIYIQILHEHPKVKSIRTHNY